MGRGGGKLYPYKKGFGRVKDFSHAERVGGAKGFEVV